MKDAKIYLGHIMEAADKIREYTSGMDEKAFISNSLVRDAVVRNIEIIGEAVKNLPAEFREKHPEIEWKDIAGMRDRIAHFYFGIDWKLVWETASANIPELKKGIEKLA